MNGGRGAKGSINDRLISMMYHNRYKLEQRKKEGYTKEEKAKQKEYIKTMRTFDMEKDTVSLEEKDNKVVQEAFKPLPIEQIGTPSLENTPVLKQEESNFIVLDNPSEEVTFKSIGSNPATIEDLSNKQVPFKSSYEERVSEIKSAGTAIESSSTPSVASIHDLSGKMIDVDIDTEVFDFEHYDYYEVLQTPKGKASNSSSEQFFVQDELAMPDSDESLDFDREIEKVEDEETILEELTTFIEDSQETLLDIKEDLLEVRELVSQSKTQEQVAELEERYAAIRAKVDKLKAQYDVVKEKYNFDDFRILESIEMMTAIEDYKDKASLDELETMVDVCKDEIDQIDGILIEEKRSVAVAEEVEEQRKAVVKRDQDFEKNREGVIYLDDLEKKIAREAREQALIIADLEKQLGKFTTDIEVVRETVYHTERLFGSFFRIAAGILTMPFNGRHIFGTMLGTHLINRGIHQLRDYMNPEVIERTEIKHRYKDIERENTDMSYRTNADQLRGRIESALQEGYTGQGMKYRDAESYIQSNEKYQELLSTRDYLNSSGDYNRAGASGMTLGQENDRAIQSMRETLSKEYERERQQYFEDQLSYYSTEKEALDSGTVASIKMDALDDEVRRSLNEYNDYVREHGMGDREITTYNGISVSKDEIAKEISNIQANIQGYQGSISKEEMAIKDLEREKADIKKQKETFEESRRRNLKRDEKPKPKPYERKKEE